MTIKLPPAGAGASKAGERRRATSWPNDDALARGCDRMWDQIEELQDRRKALLDLGPERRTAREEEELEGIWPQIQQLRAYSAFYRELLRWEANARAGHKMPPRLFLPRVG